MCNQLQALSILREAFISSNNVFNNKVSDAYLYGSFARGDYHKYSDVDIMLIVDLNTDEISDYRRSLANINSELSLKYNVTVSVTVKPLEHFRKYANVLPYYKNVINEGIRYKFPIGEIVNTPNAVTCEAFEEGDEMINNPQASRFSSVEDLYEDLMN